MITNLRLPQRTAQRPPRIGSAMVLCMLAVVVLSLGSLTIVRGHRHLNASVAANGDQTRGRAVAEGLLHRHLARLRAAGGATISATTDPSLQGTPYQWATASSGAANGGSVTVQVDLFPTSTVATPPLFFTAQDVLF
ncbi:MAG: hypothetical protein AAGC97_05040 [Planctomycetota bacterium]